MNITRLALALVLVLFLCSCKKNKSTVSISKIQVQAPFAMPDIAVPDFEKCKTFSIVDFGAIPSNKTKNSNAIAKAISAANEAGGGIVEITAGE